MIRLLGALLLAALLAAGGARAQEGPDYDAWAGTATRAESAMESAQASDDALEALRSSLADWRETFLAAQDQNSERISTLRAQIAALGPAPTPGEDAKPEAPDVAARRTELNEQLARLRAPVLAAEEAYSRADGLIREIDNLIRERRTDRLLELGPSPLNPTRWAAAAESLARSYRDIGGEIARSFRSDAENRELRNNLPLVLILTAVGLLLILRSRAWTLRLVAYLRGGRLRAARLWSFVASLGMVLLPWFGLVLLTVAMQHTGMAGLRLSPFVDKLPGWGGILLIGWWLADQVFSRDEDTAIVRLEGAQLVKARLDTWIMVICLVAHDVVSTLSNSGSYTESTSYVIHFPVLLLTSLVLFHLGHVLRGVRTDSDGSYFGDEVAFVQRLILVVAQAAMVIGLAGPLLMAVGYGAAGLALVYPAVATLLLFGLIAVLQKLFFDISDLLGRGRESEQGGLVPVLAAFALCVLALPVLALIWGARVADLTELWARFREGFQIGGTRISPSDFLTFVIIFVIGYALTRLLQAALRSSVLPRTRIDTGGQTAILSGIGYVGIFVAALIAITSAGIDLTALGYVAGALSVGIGFGVGNIVSNFVSGIILLIERPISRGDWIEVGGQMGYVRDISVRATRIETFDRTDVIVPNSDFISGTVTNYTHGNTIGRIIVPVGVAYGSDTRKVEAILDELVNAHAMVLQNPPPSVLFRGFGADSLDFEIRAILRDVNFVLSVHSDLNHEIAGRFAKEGIEIPFAQRDVWLRNPETLGPRKPASPDTPPETQAPPRPDTPEDDAD